MDHALKLQTRDHRNQHGWLLGWNSSDDPLGCLSLEKVRIGWDCRREALGRRESDWGAPDHNRSGADLFAPVSGKVPGDPYTAKSSTPAGSTSSGSGPVRRVSRHGRPPSGPIFLRISSAVTVVIRSR